MDWIQFLILISAMCGMFAWLRSDIQIQRTESASDRRDILALIREIQQEMKDFHGRLCAIEERNKK
jgi:HAMP domain-containing protein